MWNDAYECAKILAQFAVEALIAELELTPKPGLVDLRSSGSHHNMDAKLMRASAESLYECFEQMARAAYNSKPDQELREKLAFIGRAGEAQMYAVTKGINTHRGAIWCLGLLIAGCSIHGKPITAELITATAGKIASYEDRFAPNEQSNGMKVLEKYGMHGAREEARLGFPHVIDIGLPALLKYRKQGCSEDVARLHTLLAIMSTLNDTCILHRGGVAGLHDIQTRCKTVLELGGLSTALGYKAYEQLERKMLQLQLSPGGCADLLAAVLFIDSVTVKIGGD